MARVRFKPRIESLPPATVDTGSVLLFTSLTQLFQSVSDSVNTRLNAQAQEQGRIEGIRAGATASAENVPVLRDAATIKGRAFNTAATATFTARLETQARKRINDSFLKHAADPQGMTDATQAYKAGVLGKIGEANPEVAIAFDTSFDTWAQPFINKASATALAAAQAQSKQAIAAKERQLGIDLEALGPELANADPTRQRAALNAIIHQRANLEVTLAAKDQFTGAPLFSEKEKDTIRARNDTAIKKSWVRGWYANQENKTKAFLAWRRGTVRIPLVGPEGKVTMIDPKKEFPFKDNKELENFMKSERDTDLTVERTAQENQQKLRKIESEALLTDIQVMVTQNAPLSAVKAAVLKAAPRLTASDNATARALMQGGGASDDPDLLVAIQDAWEGGRDAKPLIDAGVKSGRLTGGRHTTLSATNRTMQRLRSEQNPLRFGLNLIMVNFGRDSQFANHPQVKQALNAASDVANEQFSQWFQKELERSTVPGREPGTPPTVAEVSDKVRQITLQYLPGKAKRAFFNARVPKPSPQFWVFQQVGGRLGFLEPNETATRIMTTGAERTGLPIEGMTRGDLPVDLQRELDVLMKYEKSLTELDLLEAQTLEAEQGATSGQRSSSTTGTARSRTAEQQ